MDGRQLTSTSANKGVANIKGCIRKCEKASLMLLAELVVVFSPIIAEFN
jgi:hypothetical protein